jgi:hypothetical protein
MIAISRAAVDSAPGPRRRAVHTFTTTSRVGNGIWGAQPTICRCSLENNVFRLLTVDSDIGAVKTGVYIPVRRTDVGFGSGRHGRADGYR